MSSTALDGASKYLNNLLLARGFLQNGKPIEFGGLSMDIDKKPTSKDLDRYGTTATIINLVHDLILRRDRDAEQREALASTIRTLRAEESQRLLDFQRLQDKNAQLKNDVAIAEVQQRMLAIATKKAQGEARDLKEQTLKMKSTLDQVRAKCISDIRKRDIELDKLKNHLSGLNRGKKESAAGGMKINTINIQPETTAGREFRGGQEVNNNSEWSLAKETNDFLAAVVNETSSENVALRKIVGDSMNYLKSLTGLDEQERQQPIAQDKAIGIPGQYRDRHMNASFSSAQSDSLVPVQRLAASMSEVLSHCQSILRDPSFVPIEEVQIRDEEIQKLRAGWEKMADRWKEAVTMMSQWRQKMVGDVQEHSSINSEEAEEHSPFDTEGFSGIAAFGRSIAVRPDGQPVLDAIEEEELTSMLLDHRQSRIMGDQSAITITTEQNADQEQNLQHSIHDDTLPEPDEAGTPKQAPFHVQSDRDLEAEESHLDLDLDLTDQPQPQAAPQITASPARRGIKLQKPPPSPSPSPSRQPLTTTNANTNTTTKKRKSNFITSSGPRKCRSISPPTSHYRNYTNTSCLTTLTSTADSIDTTDPLHLGSPSPSRSDTENDNNTDDDNDTADLFLPEDLNTQSAKMQIPRMTIAQKLAAVEAEASEATEVIRRRQATSYESTDRRARDRARAGKTATGTAKDRKGHEDEDGMVNVNVKKQDKGKIHLKKARDRRRRSTLTPGELGVLMAGR